VLVSRNKTTKKTARKKNKRYEFLEKPECSKNPKKLKKKEVFQKNEMFGKTNEIQKRKFGKRQEIRQQKKRLVLILYKGKTSQKTKTSNQIINYILTPIKN
jgi:hypothetical protein